MSELDKSRNNPLDHTKVHYKMSRELQAINSCSKAVLRAEDEQKLLDEICGIICNAGYLMTWIGYAENDENKTVRPLAWAGCEERYLESIKITWADTEYGNGPTGTAIREGITVYIQDFSTSSKISPWRISAGERGYQSSIALPLKSNTGTTFGAISIYSGKTNSFTPEEIQILEEMAADLSFGITTLRTRIEYKKVVDALKDSEERYRTILQNAPLGIFRTTREGRFIEVNYALAKMFGYDSPKNMVDEVSDISTQLFINPEDRKRIVSAIERHGSTTQPNVQYRTKGGRILNINLYMKTIRDINNEILYFEGFAQDATELNRAEQERINHLMFFEKMDLINRAIQGGNDQERMINNVLETLLNIFKCDRAGLLYPCDIDTDVFQLTMEKHTSDYPSELPLAVNLEADQGYLDIVRILVKKDGPVTFGPNCDYYIQTDTLDNLKIKTQMLMAIYPKGDKSYALALNQCSHERYWTNEEKRLFQEIGRRLGDALTSLIAFQNLEHRVTDRTAKLEAANRELESFAYSVSHDLRAPLRHIDGYINLLKKHSHGKCDEQTNKYIITISNASHRMGTLIDDLLSFSRMGRFEISKQRIDLSDIVRDVIQELSQDVENRNIEWKISDLPMLTADKTLLRSVMANLISNAIKFTRTREYAVIEIYPTYQNDDIVISIRDNGVGFDQQYVDKLFGVFQRLHRIDEFEGTGIGLANVRRIIERHGGKTWAEGILDHGATFSFSLPYELQMNHER